MTDPTTPRETPDDGAGATSDRTRESRPAPRTVGPRWWLIPAITFLVGLLLGGVVIGALRPGTPDAAAGPTPSASATPTASNPTATGSPATATVVVPAECLELAKDSQSLVDLTQQAAAAARDLDAGRLSDVVRQIDTAQSTLRLHADACRAVSASLDTGATPSVTSSSSTGPTSLPTPS
jgi:hypothetical protein